MERTPSFSHNIRKGLFHSFKEKNTAIQQADNDDCAQNDRQKRRVLTTGKSPTKSLDYSSHRIQVIKEAPFFRHDARRIGDGRDKHPELNDKWDRLPDVPVADVDNREPQTDSQGGEHDEEDQKGQQECAPSWRYPVPDHHAQQEEKGNS